MIKKIVFAILLVGMSFAALLYGNYKAADAIKFELQQLNQSYAEMAQQDGWPAIRLAHGAISANVLTSRFSIRDVQLSVVGLGAVLEVGQIQLKGVKPNQLTNHGRVQVREMTMGSGALLLLPETYSTFIQTIQLHGDYRYKYNVSDGELWLSQQTKINDEFQFSYQFTLAAMQPVWQRLSDVMSMSANQQRAVLDNESYAKAIASDLQLGAISHGEVHLTNNGFLQRILHFTAENGQSPSYDTVQGMAMMVLAMTDGVPAPFKQRLMTFIEHPQSLTFQFQFEQPLSFAAIGAGDAFMAFDTPEAMVKFSGARLNVNK